MARSDLQVAQNPPVEVRLECQTATVAGGGARRIMISGLHAGLDGGLSGFSTWEAEVNQFQGGLRHGAGGSLWEEGMGGVAGRVVNLKLLDTTHQQQRRYNTIF